MNLDFGTIFNNDGIQNGVRLIAIVGSLLHLLWVVLIYRQLVSASNMITTRRVAQLKLFMLVHIVVLTVILVLVIFY